MKTRDKVKSKDKHKSKDKKKQHTHKSFNANKNTVNVKKMLSADSWLDIEYIDQDLNDRFPKSFLDKQYATLEATIKKVQQFSSHVGLALKENISDKTKIMLTTVRDKALITEKNTCDSFLTECDVMLNELKEFRAKLAPAKAEVDSLPEGQSKFAHSERINVVFFFISSLESGISDFRGSVNETLALIKATAAKINTCLNQTTPSTNYGAGSATTFAVKSTPAQQQTTANNNPSVTATKVK